jgi:hypothetical protein
MDIRLFVLIFVTFISLSLIIVYTNELFDLFTFPVQLTKPKLIIKKLEYVSFYDTILKSCIIIYSFLLQLSIIVVFYQKIIFSIIGKIFCRTKTNNKKTKNKLIRLASFRNNGSNRSRKRSLKTSAENSKNSSENKETGKFKEENSFYLTLIYFLINESFLSFFEIVQFALEHLLILIELIGDILIAIITMDIYTEKDEKPIENRRGDIDGSGNEYIFNLLNSPITSISQRLDRYSILTPNLTKRNQEHEHETSSAKRQRTDRDILIDNLFKPVCSSCGKDDHLTKANALCEKNKNFNNTVS